MQKKWTEYRSRDGIGDHECTKVKGMSIQQGRVSKSTPSNSNVTAAPDIISACLELCSALDAMCKEQHEEALQVLSLLTRAFNMM
jgi:hypothetical protein